MNALSGFLLGRRVARRRPLDVDSFFRLCTDCQGDLLRLARRLTRGREDWAQDLLQDTLIRALESFAAGNYRDSDAGVRPYLMRILTHRFLNEAKRVGRWEAAVTFEVLTAGGEIGPATTRARDSEMPEGALLRSTFDEPLERALAALSDTLRATVLLVDVEGMEYTEAAQALGVPVGTIRSRLARARGLLYDALLPEARARGWTVEKQTL